MEKVQVYKGELCRVNLQWKLPVPLRSVKEYNVLVQGRDSEFYDLRGHSSVCDIHVVEDDYLRCSVDLKTFTQSPWNLREGDPLKVSVKAYTSDREYYESPINDDFYFYSMPPTETTPP